MEASSGQNYVKDLYYTKLLHLMDLATHLPIHYPRVHLWSLSWTKWIHSTPSCHIYLRFILIFPYYLSLCFPSDFFTSGFPTTVLYAFHIFPMRILNTSRWTKQSGWSANGSELCSVGTKIESRLGHQLFCLRFLEIFLS